MYKAYVHVEFEDYDSNFWEQVIFRVFETEQEALDYIASPESVRTIEPNDPFIRYIRYEPTGAWAPLYEE